MVDLDGDGRFDLLSGSYTKGLCLFPGIGRGSFRPARMLEDAEGVLIKPDNALSPFAVDWDGDGDLDLVVGDIKGLVHWIPNQSGDRRLRFGPARPLEAEGKRIGVPLGDAGPCVADWDGDGRLDLLVGAGDGGVYLYRNLTGRGEPELVGPTVLVPPSNPSRDDRGRITEPEVGYGSRAKVCVTDWNGDGRDDLLMGVFAVERQDPAVRPGSRELAEAQRRFAETNRALQEMVRLRREAIADSLGMDIKERRRPFVLQDLEKRAHASLDPDPRYQALLKELKRHSDIINAGRPTSVYHGWVWVFLRR